MSRLDRVRLHELLRSLTDRDRSICRLLDKHRVLNVHQLQEAFFDSPRCTRQRLTTLHRLGVVDRFRPQRPTGSAPFHYVLGDLGVIVRGLERGDDPAALRRDSSALRMAFSQHLDHLMETNDFFTSLLGTARRSGGRMELVEWWSEADCIKAMGKIVRPDGYGIWKVDDTQIEFCVEIDRGTETLSRVRAKLDGYQRLEEASGVARWILFVLPTQRREAEVRRVLAKTSLPIATAVSGQRSAESIWQPLGKSEKRLLLHHLLKIR